MKIFKNGKQNKIKFKKLHNKNFLINKTEYNNFKMRFNNNKMKKNKNH